MNKNEREKYEEFVKNHPAGTFFQSWAFGEFQEKIPYRGAAWALLSKNASCLVIKMRMRLGKCWLWVPYGPLIGIGEWGMEEIFEDLERIAKEERAIFARIEPFRPGAEFDSSKLKWRTVKSPERYTPEHTLVLDLEKSEDEILARMKPKGRYNISTALRHGVSVEQFVRTHKSQHFDDFYQLLKKTADRDGFKIHPKFFYETLLETFGAAGASSLFLAYSPEKKVIAGIIIIFYKDTATYYYGASSYEHRNLMAPYLLQWEAIREAKCRGMKYYDFLGIAPPGVIPHSAKQSHPYAGITEFKKKFGGREMHYPSAFDIIYKPLQYRALHLFKKS